jgi:hypothetical protein
VTLDQGQDTSLGPVEQFCEILFLFISSVKSYGSDNFKNHYVYSDLWPVTLDQGNETFSGPILWNIPIHAFSEKYGPENV